MSEHSIDIEMKRLLVTRFCQEKQIAIADYSVNDGLSLFSTIGIDLVITKDQSRPAAIRQIRWSTTI